MRTRSLAPRILEYPAAVAKAAPLAKSLRVRLLMSGSSQLDGRVNWTGEPLPPRRIPDPKQA
jgi:hypothetical protein